MTTLTPQPSQLVQAAQQAQYNNRYLALRQQQLARIAQANKK
jgi:hypothetical protein